MPKTRNKEHTTITIEQCIPSLFVLHGLKKGRDYTLGNGQLYIKTLHIKTKSSRYLGIFARRSIIIGKRLDFCGGFKLL